MILQREREKEREEQWGPSSNQVYCNSLVYLIALDFVRSSLSMIKSLEKSYETLAEGFIISLVSFLSRFIEASATIRVSSAERERSSLQDLALPFATVCARTYVLICAYLETGCCWLDRRSSWNASIQRDSIVRAAYKTRLIRSTYRRS